MCDTSDTKYCPNCTRSLPRTLEFWGVNKTYEDGLHYCCKECRGRPFGVHHSPETAKKYENNPLFVGNAVCEYCGKEQPCNEEFFPYLNSATWGRAKYKCAECSKRHKKQYRTRSRSKNTPSGVKKLENMKIRSYEVGVDFDYSPTDWVNCKAFFNNACAVCGRNIFPLDATITLAPDHWQPISKNGNSTPLNIIPLCHGLGGCNNSKKDYDPIEWLLSRYGTRQANIILARVEAYFQFVRNNESEKSA